MTLFSSAVRSVRLAFCASLLVLVVATVTEARAQIAGIPFATPSPAASGTATDAPVVLDGVTLFTVAAGNAADQLSAATRATDVETDLSTIIATTGSGNDTHTAYDPHTLRVKMARSGDEPVLQVVDATHTDPLVVVTITSADAQAHNENADALASQWQETLQGALVHALLIRQPGAQQRHITVIAIATAVLALLTFVGSLLVRSLGRRADELATEVAARNREIDAAQTQPAPLETPKVEEHQRHITALSLRLLKPSRRLTIVRAARGAIVWGLVLAWLAAVGFAALLFPETTPLGHTLLQNGFAVAAIWVVAGLLDRLLSILIGRLPLVWDLRQYANAADRTRQTLRVPTIVRALNGFKTFVLIFLAVLATMTQIGIPVGSVVTIGGVAAIAVSLAAQNLIRDVVSGFLVLAEDQFVVGDFVTINGASGIVERLTLRMVQIRDGSGSLVTIANSAATSVINHSRNWSRVDYAVSIDPAADVERAIAIIGSTIETLQKDKDWNDAILDPVEWIGIDGMSRDGIIVRTRIKTAPLRQFALQREVNLRLVRAFADAKIALGAPITPSV